MVAFTVMPLRRGDAPGAAVRHFSELPDGRASKRILYPLAEVLLLVTGATVASCDDDIVAWGRHHIEFLRGFSEFHFGVACRH
jgi:hypothetical protein